jgi:CHAT domain-containing protein
VHALPWRGEPLLAKLAVEYSIGLGSARAAGTGGDVIVIGDPTSDLPGAFSEANEAARALREPSADGARRSVRLLVRDQATSQRMSDALRGAERLHYAGHGVFAGDEGWESALPLAAGGRLTAPDILALAPAPRAVVLTGCEASKSTGDAEGLGLAQAFIVAGSLEVLAPVRPVPDALAGKLGASLYRGPVTTPLHGLARDALLRLRTDAPTSDWAAFRVLVP